MSLKELVTGQPLITQTSQGLEQLLQQTQPEVRRPAPIQTGRKMVGPAGKSNAMMTTGAAQRKLTTPVMSPELRQALGKKNAVI